MKELKPFIVFAHARSSSSRLIRTLQQHPEVHCAGEVFNEKALYVQETDVLPILGTTFADSTVSPDEFLWKFYEAAAEHEKKHVIGLKIFADHLPKDVQRQWLRDPHIQKIILSRKNILQASLSYELADHTKEYVRHPGTSLTKPSRFSVDTERMRQWMENQIAWLNECRSILQNSKQQYLECMYEDFSPRTTQEVFAYLGVSPITEFQRYHSKMAEKDTYDCIENLSEVLKELEGSEFGHLHEYVGEQAW
jgi:LPS sulfotransferase NodH